jgi:hypothetical protein
MLKKDHYNKNEILMNADENLFRERKFQENIILYLFIEAKFE